MNWKKIMFEISYHPRMKCLVSLIEPDIKMVMEFSRILNQKSKLIINARNKLQITAIVSNSLFTNV